MARSHQPASGPHRTSCLRESMQNSFVPFSVKRCTHAEQRIIISVAFCANRKSLDRSSLVYTSRLTLYIIRDTLKSNLFHKLCFQNCKDHVINYSIACILHECISPRNAKGKTKGNKNKSATSNFSFLSHSESVRKIFITYVVKGRFNLN